MLIRDLEYKTGLDRATIRYYEKESLIVPIRKENGYREYTDEHLACLLKIKLLRQLGMSLDTIKELQQGTADFNHVLAKQIIALDAKIKQATRAKEICIQLRDDKASYKTLDAQRYLQLLSQKEHTSLPKVFSENIPHKFHPWRRYFARIFDYGWITLLISTLFYVVFRIRPLSNWLAIFIQYGSLLLAMPIQAMMLHVWGTTPGKWLFGLTVLSENGNKLDYEIAMNREWQALLRGYGLGLPIFSIVRLIMSYCFYRDARLNWDDNTEIQYNSLGRKRKVLVAAAVICLTFCRLWVTADEMLPKYRGELTVEEFAQNYNFYAKMGNEDAVKMHPDGSFTNTSDNVVIIDIAAAESTNKDHMFEFDEINGKIETISYQNTWSDVALLRPVTYKCQMAALTAIMSQRGTNVFDLIQVARLVDNSDYTSDGSIQYENVHASWDVEQRWCQIAEGNFIPERGLDEKQIPTVSVVFTIRISV